MTGKISLLLATVIHTSNSVEYLMLSLKLAPALMVDSRFSFSQRGIME